MDQMMQEGHLAFHCFLAAYSVCLSQISRDLTAQTELTLEQYDVLLNLEVSEEGKMRLKDLAERALLSRSGLTRLIDRMERSGLVQREVCLDDRRGYFAVLTEKGREARENAWPILRDSIERHFITKAKGPSDHLHVSRVLGEIALQHGYDVFRERARYNNV